MSRTFCACQREGELCSGNVGCVAAPSGEVVVDCGWGNWGARGKGQSRRSISVSVAPQSKNASLTLWLRAKVICPVTKATVSSGAQFWAPGSHSGWGGRMDSPWWCYPLGLTGCLVGSRGLKATCLFRRKWARKSGSLLAAPPRFACWDPSGLRYSETVSSWWCPSGLFCWFLGVCVGGGVEANFPADFTAQSLASSALFCCWSILQIEEH